MLRKQFYRTVITASIIAGGFNAGAQTSGHMTPEVEIASYAILCEGYAKTHAPQDMPFWQEVKSESDAADLRKAERSLGAVEASLSQIDPALIAKRCNDFKDVWNDPQESDYEEPSEQVQAITAKVQENMSGLIDQMVVANFAPDDANIALKYLAALSNVTPDRMEVARHMDDALNMMRKSLTSQQRRLATPNAAEALSSVRRGELYICAVSAKLRAAQALDGGQYEYAHRFAAEHVLWAALINRERKLGQRLFNDADLIDLLPDPINGAMARLNAGQSLAIKDQRAVNMAEDMCFRAVPVKITDQYITAPIFAAAGRLE